MPHGIALYVKVANGLKAKHSLILQSFSLILQNFEAAKFFLILQWKYKISCP